MVKHFIDIADMMKTVMSNEKVAFTGHRSIPFATINVLRQRISDCSGWRIVGEQDCQENRHDCRGYR